MICPSSILQIWPIQLNLPTTKAPRCPQNSINYVRQQFADVTYTIKFVRHKKAVAGKVCKTVQFRTVAIRYLLKIPGPITSGLLAIYTALGGPSIGRSRCTPPPGWLPRINKYWLHAREDTSDLKEIVWERTPLAFHSVDMRNYTSLEPPVLTYTIYYHHAVYLHGITLKVSVRNVWSQFRTLLVYRTYYWCRIL